MSRTLPQACALGLLATLGLLTAFDAPVISGSSVGPGTLVTLSPARAGGSPQVAADDGQALMRAERAFAQLNQERGQRQAWLAWFAADGVMFNPGPVNARTTMGGMSDADAAPPGAFDWRPTIGLLARSGDLGFNSGPVRVGGNRSASSFFSIWKKQRDGSWRVVVDLGVPTDYRSHDPFDDSYRLLPAGPAAIAEEPEAVLETIEKAATTGAGLLARMDSDARGLRSGEPPLVGLDTFTSQFSATAVSLEPLGSGVSQAGDFGYTFGRFRFGGPTGEHGYYARAWRRNAAGDWRVLFDVMRREP